MKKNVLIRSITITACMMGALLMTTSVEAKGYGKVIGKFVFKGKSPSGKSPHQKRKPCCQRC